MRQWIINIALGIVVTYLEKNKTVIVKYINQEVDIPGLSEKEEKIVYNKIYESIITIFKIKIPYN